MDASVGRSDDVEPDDFQPPLTRWGHTWRLLLMLVASGVAVLDRLVVSPWPWPWWRLALDLACGVVAYVAVHFRRRHPVPVAGAVIALSAVSSIAAGPAMLATVSLATRRVYGQLAMLMVLNVGAALVYHTIVQPAPDEPLWVVMIFSGVVNLAAVGWGMYIGSRRELLWTLRQRAERAEAERDLRAGMARADERARIAREMHDVLAHRISQVSMHAGALGFRGDLDADALRAGIAEVQAKANEALTDLRGVLGVLRDRETGEVTHHPQPTYDDVPRLVDDARAAGARVKLEDRISAGPVPPALGRTLYRVVQEGITNANKHAPGALLTVEVAGHPDDGVEVVLRNPVGLGPPAAPGAGLGLVGLAERVELAGGMFTHGREGGSFLVRASLPWSS